MTALTLGKEGLNRQFAAPWLRGECALEVRQDLSEVRKFEPAAEILKLQKVVIEKRVRRRLEPLGGCRRSQIAPCVMTQF